MTFKTTLSTLTVVMAAVIALCPATNSWAGEGHDHGGISATPSMNGPQRLPDGSVFLPKSAQRQLVIRTIKAEIADLPKSIELNGKVSMDPNAGGKVQAINAGRVEAGPKGLPKEVVDKVSAATKQALSDPAVKKRIEDTGSLVIGNTPEEFAAQIKAEFEVYKKVVDSAKLKLD